MPDNKEYWRELETLLYKWVNLSVKDKSPEHISLVNETLGLIGDEPAGLGHWMIEFEQKMRVQHRITCDELGYPMCEACYVSVEEWEKETGKNWIEYIASIA